MDSGYEAYTLADYGFLNLTLNQSDPPFFWEE